MKKNEKRKKSSMRKLVAAACMLGVSATMLSGATYAWFTMNREVSVTNMQVQATAEGGLLISETSGHGSTDQWDDVATANNLPTGVVLLPTSTTNSSAWYHANSKSANDEAGAGATSTSANLSGSYATLSSLSHSDTAAVSGTNAANSIYYTDGNSNSAYAAADDSAYYVQYTYWLKTSNENGITGLALSDGAQSLSIKNVTVTNNDNVSVALNKSLRVGVKINNRFYIFAPNYDGTSATPTDYYVFDGSSGTDNIQVTPLAANGVAYTDVTSLNGITTESPLRADVFLWYEGEDENCKSENITATLDTLVVGLKFELNTNSGAKSLPTHNAFSIS